MPYPAVRFPALFQKDSFCLPKGLVLVHKRTPFGVQKDSFYNPKGVHLKISICFLLQREHSALSYIRRRGSHHYVEIAALKHSLHVGTDD